MRDALKRILSGDSLSRDESEAIFKESLSGSADPVVLAGLLIAMAQRGETADEVTGAAAALRNTMTPFEHSFADAIDTCGTGGDGLGTFNISTTSAIVAAAAGAKVVKHGNRAVSSSCGSADLLETVGVRIDLPANAALECLNTLGITFLFAPGFHPAMRHAGPIRRALGVRTIFNLIGPLANPGRVRRQVLGVSDPGHLNLHSAALENLGVAKAVVVHGGGGADELTLEPGNQIVEIGSEATTMDLPADVTSLGLASCPVADLKGGDAQENAALLREVLEGTPGPVLDAVLLNSACALYVAGISPSMQEGVERARTAIESGRAQETLTQWAALSQKLGG